MVLARVKGEIWDPPFTLDLNIPYRGWRAFPVRLRADLQDFPGDGVRELAGGDLEELPGMDLRDSLEANEQGSPGVLAAGRELIAGLGAGRQREG